MLKKTILACMSVLAVAAASLLLKHFSPERRLLVLATKIEGVNANQPYFWLSDHTLLTAPSPSYYFFERYDTQLKTKTPLTAFPSLFCRMHCVLMPKEIPFTVSPDGERVVTVGPHGKDKLATPAWTVMSINGLHELQWPVVRREDQCIWMPDNRHLAELHTYNPNLSSGYTNNLFPSAHIRDVDVSQNIRHFGGSISQRDCFLYDCRITPGGRLVAAAYAGTSNSGPVTITQWHLGTSLRLIRQQVISRPLNLDYSDVKLSPNGNYIAWQLDFPPPASHLAWIRKSLDFFGISQQPIFRRSLWISRLDGSQMHEIGEINDASEDGPSLSALQWLPGSKALSFEYHRKNSDPRGIEYQQTLYTVPAD